jgi:UDP-N-acetyl-D-mannosaminuronic acid dehydrogenase
LINSNDYSVTIVGGCGHVGLPLACFISNKGLKVRAYDTNSDAVKEVNNATLPFIEPGVEKMLKEGLENGNFLATSDPSCVRDSNIIIIVVGTPVDSDNNPSSDHIFGIIEDLASYFNANQIIMLRSTVYPGTTEEVAKRILKYTGVDNLINCPERLAEGKAIEELGILPQIIGADTEFMYEKSKQFFNMLGIRTLKLSRKESEFAKLFSNAWRYIKFAATNELYTIAESNNCSYKNIRDAMMFQYPRNSDLPFPGFAAGPCLVKDTSFLSTYMANKFLMGNTALMINEGLPMFVVSELEKKYDLKNMVVGILGMTFKPEIDDIRSSLSFKLKKSLLLRSQKVLMSDPFASHHENKPLSEVLSDSDLIIIATPHSEYEKLEFSMPVFSIWE